MKKIIIITKEFNGWKNKEAFSMRFKEEDYSKVLCLLDSWLLCAKRKGVSELKVVDLENLLKAENIEFYWGSSTVVIDLETKEFCD